MRIVIPARYASTRLPGKPLADIAGKPMIQHVYERALEAAENPRNVIIAADDERIIAAARKFGARAMLTNDTHESGTDRIAEISAERNWPEDMIVVNLQGDEPLMPAPLIKAVVKALVRNPDAAIATASCPILRAEDVENPNIVKVVTASTGAALYFSRAGIPYDRSGLRDMSAFPYQRHIGLYAYRAETLRKLTEMPVAPLEDLEKLEQLRALAAGMKIQVVKVAEAPPHGVDTEDDLAAVRAHFEHLS